MILFVAFLILNGEKFFIVRLEAVKMYIAFRVISIIFVGLLVAGLIELIEKIKNKSKKAKAFLKYFSIYFGIMFVFLILTWPGIFKGDEFYVFLGLPIFRLNYMQHYLLSSFYIISLMIFPAMATITFLQILIISSIVGYILMKLEEILENKKLVWLFFIPLLLLPTIDNNLFPLRNSIITYLLLLIIFEIFMLYIKKKKNIEISKKEYIKIIAFASICGALKTEYMVLIFLIPIALIFLLQIKVKDMILYFAIMLTLSIIINIPQKNPYNNSYILTAMINPLSTIVADENAKNITDEDIKKIDSYKL